MINLYSKLYDNVWFGVAYNDKSVFATAFSTNREQVLRNLLASIPFDIPFQYAEEGTFLAERVLATLRDIYNGKDVDNKFSLNMEPLSDYMQKVLKATAKIPAGYVTSYGAIAKAVGGSPRAVGRAMALNPFPLLIPCHRVVASDFSLGGYGGGLQVKLEILSREKRGYKEEEISIDGRRLKIFPVELVLERVSKENVKFKHK
ncbi:MAG: methylated-DNA--[protein]-cysteine S-methyltransferase [Candidatus Bathyarchaeia archaeon]